MLDFKWRFIKWTISILPFSHKLDKEKNLSNAPQSTLQDAAVNVPFPHRNTNFTMESFFQVVLWFSRGLSGT